VGLQRLQSLVVTVVFATYAVGVLAALLLVGRLSDQVGRKAVLLPGLGVAAASSLVFLIPHSLPALFVGRLLSGVCRRERSPGWRPRRSSTWLRTTAAPEQACSLQR
jgi:MFS family permease